MNESVQKTNIPTIRKPFGADLPPRVPYCLADNVGSPVCPVYVEGKQIKASNANVGGPTTPIYLKNGVFIAGRSTANLSVETNPEFETEPWIARLVLNPDSPDEHEYVLHAAGGSGSSEFENLNVPLLTPMWFDYVPADTKSWIPSDGNFHSGTNADYARIWNHLSSECAGKTNNKSQTFGSITIDYFECADGHHICICNSATAEGVRTKLNTLVDASHPEIGTAWFYIINTDTKEFYLPRTRYGFHGDLNYVKFAQAGEHAMRLFFHTGNGPGSDNKMDKVTTENGFEADAVPGNVAIYSSREPGQVIDSGHKIVSGVGTPAGTDLVTVDYMKQEISKSEGTRTPLIDWTYVESGLNPGQAKWVDNLAVTWKYSNALYNQIYPDGRYALYIYPLKEDFTKYKEICFVFGDYSGGTPDIATKIVRSRDLDWAMSLPVNGACTNLYSILIPGSQVLDYTPLICPYGGSPLWNHNVGSKSTKRKLVTLDQKYSAIILEIYGLN